MTQHNPRKATFEDRFWSHVERGEPDVCWPWIGGHNERGAGLATMPGPKKRMGVATRILWTFTYGEIPAGLQVLHRCDNPPCVNPAHLFLGTRSDNMRDMFAKGRADVGRRPGEPHVKLTPDKLVEIRLLAAAGTPIRVLAREYGVWPSSIRSALKRTAA